MIELKNYDNVKISDDDRTNVLVYVLDIMRKNDIISDAEYNKALSNVA